MRESGSPLLLNIFHRFKFVAALYRSLNVAALFVALTFIALAIPALASAKEIRIQNFASHISVARDGTIDVTEKIDVQFVGGPWHGLYRSIPIEYVTPQGLNYPLFLDIKSITDASGHKLKYESSRVRHYRKLKIY